MVERYTNPCRSSDIAARLRRSAGDAFNSFYPVLSIGLNKALYVGVYGGFMSISDSHDTEAPNLQTLLDQVNASMLVEIVPMYPAQ